MSDQELQLAKEEQVQNMLNHIEELMAHEHYEQALGVLNYAMKVDLFDLRVYERYAFVMRMLGRTEAAELFEYVVMHPGDAEAYYKIATRLIQEKIYGSAVNPLKKVLELVPMAASANFELGYAFMKEFEMDLAVEYFEHAFDLSRSPNTAFYTAYSNLLSNNTARTKELIPYMEEEYRKAGQGTPLMLQILKDMLARYEAFPPKTLRDWHFVQYGTPLLRLSEDDIGHPVETLNGRYVFINYGFLTVATILQTLKRMVEEVPNFPKFDYIIPASFRVAPMGFALSKMLNIPLAGPEVLQTGLKGLALCGWTDDVEAVAKTLLSIPDVTLFSFALNWTQHATIVPDLIGYFDQANRFPWEDAVEITPEGERKHRPAVTGTPEELAEIILSRLEETPTEEIERVVAYYKERSEYLRVNHAGGDPRLGFQVESPIVSARMMI